jgi:hypothetical protein
VRVLFSIIEKSNGDYVVEFNFENESLKHKLDSTMRTNMFEVSTFSRPNRYSLGSIGF